MPPTEVVVVTCLIRESRNMAVDCDRHNHLSGHDTSDDRKRKQRAEEDRWASKCEMVKPWTLNGNIPFELSYFPLYLIGTTRIRHLDASATTLRPPFNLAYRNDATFVANSDPSKLPAG